MKEIKLTEEFLKDKVQLYLNYINKNKWDKITINQLPCGCDIYTTENDNLIFDVYYMEDGFNEYEEDVQARFWVDTKTFEYKVRPISLIDDFSYITTLDNASLIHCTDIPEEDKIIFDGIAANTLWQCFYGEYKEIHPIYTKYLQTKLYGQCKKDDI